MSRPRMQVSTVNREKSNSKKDDDEITKDVEITCRESFHQYLLNSTLHGLKYVGDRSLSLFER